jgi:hypothetical protein
MPAQVSAEDFPRLVAAFKRVLAEENFAENLSLAKETSHALFCGDKGNFATLKERIDAFMLRNARTLFHAFCLLPRYGLRVFHSDDQGSLHGQLLRSRVSQQQANVLAVEWDAAMARVGAREFFLADHWMFGPDTVQGYLFQRVACWWRWRAVFCVEEGTKRRYGVDHDVFKLLRRWLHLRKE